MGFDIIRATSEHAIDVGYVHAISWHAAYLGLIGEDYLNHHFTPQVAQVKFSRESFLWQSRNFTSDIKTGKERASSWSASRETRTRMIKREK